MFDVRFVFTKKGRSTSFKIFAVRLDKPEENYEIEIQGSKRIKNVMKQFRHEYLAIVDNLRIMGDALVLLNPVRSLKQQFFEPPHDEDPADLSKNEMRNPA